MKSVIYGTHEVMVRYRLEQLKKAAGLPFVEMDTQENSQEEILSEIYQQDLFGERRFVVVHNGDFIKRKAPDENFASADFEKIPAQESDFAILCSQKPSAQACTRLLKAGFQLVDATGLDPKTRGIVMGEIIDEFGLQLNVSQRIWLSDHLGEDPFYWRSEIEKISLLSRRPSQQELEKIVVPSAEISLFTLSDAFFERKPLAFLKTYRQFRSQNVEPQAILGLLAGQVRFLLQVRTLIDQRWNNEEIARSLQVSPGRIYYSRKNAERFSRIELLSFLAGLSELDQQIKTGRIDKDTGLETLILRRFWRDADWSEGESKSPKGKKKHH